MSHAIDCVNDEGSLIGVIDKINLRNAIEFITNAC